MVMGRHHGGRSRSQRGFTLIEMMVTVAIIAILAIVAVPAFFREGRKVKADSEVNAMFAEITAKMEQWKVEKGAYTNLAPCPATVPSGTAIESSTCRDSTEWLALRINPPESKMRCSYEVVAGTKDDDATNPLGFVWASPEVSWYYVTATCDLDGSAGTNAMFFVSSTDSKIKKQNEAN